MDKLSSVIGFAPSEDLWTDFKKRLSGERDRIRKSFDLWSQGKFKASPRASKKGLKLQDMKAIAQELNITLEELTKLFAQKGE